MLFGSKTCLIARKYAISSFERVVNIGVAIAVQLWALLVRPYCGLKQPDVFQQPERLQWVYSVEKLP